MLVRDLLDDENGVWLLGMVEYVDCVNRIAGHRNRVICKWSGCGRGRSVCNGGG